MQGWLWCAHTRPQRDRYDTAVRLGHDHKPLGRVECPQPAVREWHPAAGQARPPLISAQPAVLLGPVPFHDASVWLPDSVRRIARARLAAPTIRPSV